MPKLILGLEIGISSVGWEITNEDSGDISSASVCAFEEATRNASEDSYSLRSSRQLKRRTKRNSDFLGGLICQQSFLC